MSAALTQPRSASYRFKRWTRTAWGAFCSLRCEVSIARLTGEVASALTSKTRNKSLVQGANLHNMFSGEANLLAAPPEDEALDSFLTLYKPILLCVCPQEIPATHNRSLNAKPSPQRNLRIPCGFLFI